MLLDCWELANNLKIATATDVKAANKILKKFQEEVVDCITQVKDVDLLRCQSKDGRSQVVLQYFSLMGDSIDVIMDNQKP